MAKQTIPTLNPARVAVAASRQVWLAGLGVAMVTRDWARNDAGEVFKSLVKEGSTVETRVIRAVGHRLNSSIAVAQSGFSKARHTAIAGMNDLVDTAAAAWPKLGSALTSQRAAAKPRKSGSHQGARKTRRGKRSAARI